MIQQATPTSEPDQDTRDFYLHSLDLLEQAQIPYVVGGGYAMACYTGIVRHTKDLDVFVRPEDRFRTLDTLAAAGYRVEWTWPHFLGKALHGQAFVDVLFNSGNGLTPVDDEWFSNAVTQDVLGRPAPLSPAEEMLWTKAFVQDRDRFDGADVAHLILARGPKFDWERLLRRFQGHERVLLGHLFFYTYIYPTQRENVPDWVMHNLLECINCDPPPRERLCMGPFLAQRGYLFDVNHWGFIDARLKPRGPLTPKDIASLTPP